MTLDEIKKEFALILQAAPIEKQCPCLACRAKRLCQQAINEIEHLQQKLEEKEPMKCKHRKTWLLGLQTVIEWCYECGAIRGMLDQEPNVCRPTTTWVRPTGEGGDNPYAKMRPLKGGK